MLFLLEHRAGWTEGTWDDERYEA